MAITLGHNQYGKAETRVVRVFRDTEPHEIVDYNVSVALSRRLRRRPPDRRQHATASPPTPRRTPSTRSRRRRATPPASRSRSASRWRSTSSTTSRRSSRVRIKLEAYPWDRLSHNGSPHPHAFARRGVLRPHRHRHLRRQPQLWVVSGVRDLVVLKTTDSEFHTFYQERYTTLQPTHDRVMASSVTAQWLHTAAHDTDWGTSYDRVLATMSEHLRRPPQPRAAADDVRDGRGRSSTSSRRSREIRFSMPNKHHFLVDLSPFGLENKNEVFHADDRPYGYIEGTVRRDDAPNPGSGRVRPRSGLVTPGNGPHLVRHRDGRPPPGRRDAARRAAAPLRPAARDEHVRRRDRGAADRRQRAGPAVRRPGLPAHRRAARLRARHAAADDRRLADRRQAADGARHVVRGRRFHARHRHGRRRRRPRAPVHLRRHPGRRDHRVPAVAACSTACCTSSRPSSPGRSSR